MVMVIRVVMMMTMKRMIMIRNVRIVTAVVIRRIDDKEGICDGDEHGDGVENGDEDGDGS